MKFNRYQIGDSPSAEPNWQYFVGDFFNDVEDAKYYIARMYGVHSRNPIHVELDIDIMDVPVAVLEAKVHKYRKEADKANEIYHNIKQLLQQRTQNQNV